MDPSELTSFPSEVAFALQSYVYRLIDPRNGETSYVGKGKGDRVFSHLRAERGQGEDALEHKFRRIRDIRLAGLTVGHVIHRHGLDDETATAVEAALIDAYPGLTNVVGGQNSGDYGPMHALQAIERYKAPVAAFHHKTMLISINRSVLESVSIYDAVRFAWRLDVGKARQAEMILATVQGLIVGVFQARVWLSATAENFPGRETIPDRWGFHGDEADLDVAAQYLRHRVPDAFRIKGAANPIRYTW